MPVCVLTYSCVSLRFPSIRVKTKIRFNTHTHCTIWNFYHEWHLLHPQNVASSHQEDTSKKFLLIWFITFRTSLSTCIMTSNDLTLSRGPGGVQLHSIRTSDPSHACSDSLPSNLWLNMNLSIHYSFCCLNSRIYLQAKPLACLKASRSQYFFIYFEKLFFGSN